MFEEMKNRTVMITGATGLIGQGIVRRLLDDVDARVLAVVRSVEKAQRLFGENKNLSYIVSDILKLEVAEMDVDYIIHAASNTSSKAFIQDPIGITFTALEGTKRVLELAKINDVKGFVFLSSMEVYGSPATDEKIDELHSTNLNTMAIRSAYPESKRMCENLCASYCAQHSVPVKVIRLTQTFGPGVLYNDSRVFAEFARCAIEGHDIVLHTKGETKRSYLYTEDAVSAILTVLLKGTIGEAYNAANEETYCSIFEMAEMVAREFGGGKISVVVNEGDNSSFGYAPILHMNLDTRKIRELGWKPSVGLNDMFRRMILDMKSTF